MPPARRVGSNGRSPLVRKQSQITTFFSPGKTPKAPLSPSSHPGPNTNPTPSSVKKKKKTPLRIGKKYLDEVVGKKIRVFWPLDDTWHQGEVKSFDRVNGKHLIHFEDAEEEHLDLDKEKIEWVEETQPRILRRLRRMSGSPVSKIEAEKSKGEEDDVEDEDWEKGKDVRNEEKEEEEAVAVRSRRSSCAGSGKRKKNDIEKLGCCKKFRFDEDGDEPLITPASKSKSFSGSTAESK